MTTPPIATASFLRRWRRLHRRETGEVLLRHVCCDDGDLLVRHAGQGKGACEMGVAQVERAFYCDTVAEHVAASLRPDLFAHVIREALFDGQLIPRVPADLAISDVEKAFIRRAEALAEGKTTAP